jgi:2-keto-4-pentenoate hydratase
MEQGVDRHGEGHQSTGTCTGHFFAAPGDHLEVDYGPIGKISVHYA